MNISSHEIIFNTKISSQDTLLWCWNFGTSYFLRVIRDKLNVQYNFMIWLQVNTEWAVAFIAENRAQLSPLGFTKIEHTFWKALVLTIIAQISNIHIFFSNHKLHSYIRSSCLTIQFHQGQTQSLVHLTSRYNHLPHNAYFNSLLNWLCF